MNISLTPELEELVQQKVKSSGYSSASEVIHEALLLLKEQEELKQHRLKQLRQEIAIGLDQLERGEKVPAQVVFDTLRQRSKDRRNGKI